MLIFYARHLRHCMVKFFFFSWADTIAIVFHAMIVQGEGEGEMAKFRDQNKMEEVA